MTKFHIVSVSVSYTGIVTSCDPHLASVFTLDKTVKVQVPCKEKILKCAKKYLQVIVGLVTVVTNARCPSPGQEVTVHRAHLAKFAGVRWIGSFSQCYRCLCFLYDSLLFFSAVWNQLPPNP